MGETVVANNLLCHTAQITMWSKVVLCALQVYFIVIAFAVERSYCARPLSQDDTGLLMKQTYDFSVVHNRLFLERPEWLRMACCVSSTLFPLNYFAVLLATLADAWHLPSLRVFLLVFTGIKVYALGFYHLMEFTSHAPPENLIPYFATEGPYLVSMAMVLLKIWEARNNTNTTTKKQKKT